MSRRGYDSEGDDAAPGNWHPTLMGQLAFEAGRSLDDCPFGADNPQREEWIRSWATRAMQARAWCLAHPGHVHDLESTREALREARELLGRVGGQWTKQPARVAMDLRRVCVLLDRRLTALQSPPTPQVVAAGAATAPSAGT